MDRLTVAILGAGRVGQAVGALLREAGYSVTAVTARTLQAAQAAALATGGTAYTDNTAAARAAQLVLVTVPDDVIESAVADIAADGGFAAGQVVAHTSGAHGLGVLAPAAEAGAAIGAIHPMQSFATATRATQDLPGSIFGFTADDDAREVLLAVVESLGGHAVDVADEVRPLYHAAAVMASNGFVAVEDMATNLLVSAGFDERAARRALVPLVAGTTINIRRFGPKEALTGPVSRGDFDTVRAHLEALQSAPESHRQAYLALNAHAADMAEEVGMISHETATELRAVLGGDEV